PRTRVARRPHTFPTRRSSDLAAAVERERRGKRGTRGYEETTRTHGTTSRRTARRLPNVPAFSCGRQRCGRRPRRRRPSAATASRSEEHTSELQSRVDRVCRLL